MVTVDQRTRVPAVVVNKMDKVGLDVGRFQAIRAEISSYSSSEVSASAEQIEQMLRFTAAAELRVLSETIASPSLPLVTSSTTRKTEATKMTEALFELFHDPATADIRAALELKDIAVPDVAAYE